MNTAPAKKIEVIVETTARWVPLNHSRGFTTLATILVNGTLVAKGNIEGKRIREDVIPAFVRDYKRWNIINKDYLALAQSVGKIPALTPKVEKRVKPVKKLSSLSSLMEMAETSIKSGDGLRKVAHLFATTRQFLLNNGINTAELDSSWDKVVRIVEDFPIHTEDLLPNRSIMFFILSGGEWWPVHAGELHEKHVFGPLLNYRIDYVDGSSESGPAVLGKWANCTADDQPSVPDEVGYWENYKEYLKIPQEGWNLPDHVTLEFAEWFYQHQKNNQSDATKAIYAEIANNKLGVRLSSTEEDDERLITACPIAPIDINT